jgi:hypothetical protein
MAQNALLVAASENAAWRAISGASSDVFTASIAGHAMKNSAAPSHFVMVSFEHIGELSYLLWIAATAYKTFIVRPWQLSFQRHTHAPEERAQLLKQLKEVDCSLVRAPTGLHTCKSTLDKREDLDLQLFRHLNCRPRDTVGLANIKPRQCCDGLKCIVTVTLCSQWPLDDIPLLEFLRRRSPSACCSANVRLHRPDPQTP